MSLSIDYLLVLAGWLVALKCATGIGRAPIAGVSLCWVFSQYVNNCGFFPLLRGDYDPEAAWRSPLFLGYGVTREGTLAGQWYTLLCVAIVLIGSGASAKWSKGLGSPARVSSFSPTVDLPYLRFRAVLAIALALAYSRLPFDLPLKGAAQLVAQSLSIAGSVVEYRHSKAVSQLSWRDYALRSISILLALQSVFFGGFASYAFFLLGPTVVVWATQIGERSSGRLWSTGRLVLIMVMLPLAAGAWMNVRGALRSALWVGQRNAALFDGVAALTDLDILAGSGLEDAAQEGLLIRFNHAHWVDRVEVNHRLHPELRGESSRVGYVAISWVPRYLWPSKPQRNSGGEFLGRHAGHVFSTRATFGYGIIIDAFVYAGWLGVVVLLGVLGVFMGLVDCVVIRASSARDLGLQWVAWAAVSPWFDPLVDAFDGSSASVISFAVAMAVVRIRR